MREGTIKVREILPADSTNFTDKQIQEALWHYYYDIEKSVTYLLGTLTPRVPKKAAGKKGSGELISLRRESFFLLLCFVFFCRIINTYIFWTGGGFLVLPFVTLIFNVTLANTDDRCL